MVTKLLLKELNGQIQNQRTWKPSDLNLISHTFYTGFSAYFHIINKATDTRLTMGQKMKFKSCVEDFAMSFLEVSERLLPL